MILFFLCLYSLFFLKIFIQTTYPTTIETATSHNKKTTAALFTDDAQRGGAVN